jgi:hypothetical protein
MKKLHLYFFLFFILCNLSLAQSSLPECKGNETKNPIKKFAVAKKWSNCHGTQLTPTGKVGYVGEFYKGQPHGIGVFTYAGRKYEGQWKFGKQHGEGTYTYRNGDKYTGEWKGGKYYGNGTYIYSNGDKYIGEWKKRKFNKPDNKKGKNGTGTYIYKNGDKYIGEWKKGLRHGKGIFKHANGKIENGIWKKDKLEK